MSGQHYQEVNPAQRKDMEVVLDGGLYFARVGTAQIPIVTAEGKQATVYDLKAGERFDLHFDEKALVYRSDIGLSRRQKRAIRAKQRSKT